jgi:hypothetical protein
MARRVHQLHRRVLRRNLYGAGSGTTDYGCECRHDDQKAGACVLDVPSELLTIIRLRALFRLWALLRMFGNARGWRLECEEKPPNP